MAYPKFEDLKGKTLKRAEKVSDDRIEFEDDAGRVYALYHSQDCCEMVEVESIVGDMADLIGNPILLAEEAESDKTPEGVTLPYEPESQTWTFYKLGTIKGSVDIRWHGTSNGYYSESVSFYDSSN